MLDYNPTSHGYEYYVIIISAGIKILKNPRVLSKVCHGYTAGTNFPHRTRTRRNRTRTGYGYIPTRILSGIL
jgi:hypothetical protein